MTDDESMEELTGQPPRSISMTEQATPMTDEKLAEIKLWHGKGEMFPAEHGAIRRLIAEVERQRGVITRLEENETSRMIADAGIGTVPVGVKLLERLNTIVDAARKWRSGKLDSRELEGIIGDNSE